MNIQPIEKRLNHSGEVLDVHSIFYTIQGEGPFSGRAAVFLRLAGCNLQCPACDTEYTQGRRPMTIDTICTEIYRVCDSDHNFDLPLVVITGGEPFRQNLTPLCNMLMSWLGRPFMGFDVQIETNGTLAPSKDLPVQVTVVCSPKTPTLNSEMAERVNYFKYVLSHESVSKDGLPIHVLGNKTSGKRVARPPEGHFQRIFIQPIDRREVIGIHYTDEEDIAACVKSAKTHGHIVQLQLHKLLGVE